MHKLSLQPFTLFKLMFADDTAGLAFGDNLPILFAYVNEEIKKILLAPLK